MDTITDGVLVGDMNGSLVGNPSIVPNFRSGGMLTLNGEGQYISYGEQTKGTCLHDFSHCEHKSFSISLWLRVKENIDSDIFSNSGGTQTTKGVELSYKSSAQIIAKVKTENDKYNLKYTSSGIFGKWHHYFINFELIIRPHL